MSMQRESCSSGRRRQTPRCFMPGRCVCCSSTRQPSIGCSPAAGIVGHALPPGQGHPAGERLSAINDLQAWGVMEFRRGNISRARELFQEGVWADPDNRDVAYVWQVQLIAR